MLIQPEISGSISVDGSSSDSVDQDSKRELAIDSIKNHEIEEEKQAEL